MTVDVKLPVALIVASVAWGCGTNPAGDAGSSALTIGAARGGTRSSTGASHRPEATPSERRSPNNGPLPDGCAKIEGGAIGGEGIVLVVGSATVTIDGWTEKDGEPGEYVGFSYTATGGDVVVSVKAGREVYAGDGSGAWAHPGGTSGRTAHAISNVVFCPGEPGSGGEPDPGSGGEPDPGSGGEPDPGSGGGGGGGTPCESDTDCATGEVCAPAGYCAPNL